MTTTTDIRTRTISNITGAKELQQYINEQTGLIQQIREEYFRDLQQPITTVTLPIFLNNSSWNFCAELCQNAHKSFIYRLTGLPQFSTFLQKEETFNEVVDQLERLRKMLITNKQQKKTAIRKIQEIIKLVKETERQEEQRRVPSPAFDFVMTTLSMDDHDHDHDHDDDGILIEADDSVIVKALKAQIETTKQNHRTISRNLLQQVNFIVKAVRRHIVDVKRSAEDNVGEIIHHAEKCRAFIAKCFDYSVLLYCASAWWHQTQKDAMDDGYYHIEVECVNPDDAIFNPNAAATTEHNIRICVYHGDSIDPNHIVHVYDYDQDLAQAIYTPEIICEVEKILRRFRTGIVVATCEA
jgi:hypothetical protein